jgi:hypothetical protein
VICSVPRSIASTAARHAFLTPVTHDRAAIVVLRLLINCMGNTNVKWDCRKRLARYGVTSGLRTAATHGGVNPTFTSRAAIWARNRGTCGGIPGVARFASAPGVRSERARKCLPECVLDNGFEHLYVN